MNEEKEATVIKTDVGAKDGQTKCPKCGATDISLNTKNGKLRCNFCRYEFEPEKFDAMETDISNLQGEVVGSGASDIIADTNDMVTFKCSSCGAEVVVDTAQATQARCHWCRNTLSVNQQIPNGAVPDTVLPFKISKKEAKESIEQFVGKRKFYAHPQFRREFTTENVMGVYLPYMIVDANAHANLQGQGEVETRSWTEKNGDTYRTYYDADVYDIERDFDLTIEGLTVESSKDKLDRSGKTKTNNIINSIMPFDTENCVKWDSNYIKGYTSEKRDTNVDELKELVNNKKNENLYTEDSYKKYADIYADASKILTTDGLKYSIQKDVDEAVKKLKDAQAQLEIKVNKDELDKLYTDKKDFKEESYTADSWKVFKDALLKAQEVLNNENATQEEVNQAYGALKEATDALKTKTTTPSEEETKGDKLGNTNGQGDNQKGQTTQERNTINRNKSKVKTGDNMKVVPYALLMMAAAGGYVTVCRRNKEN